MFTRFTNPYIPVKFRLEKTIKTWHIRLLFFYKRIKFENGKKQNCLQKRHNFLMTKIIKIRRHGFVGERTDNMLSEFLPIWSRAADLKLEMHVQLAYFLTFEKQIKTKIPRLSHQRRNRRGIPFLYNNRSVTVNM